MKNEKGCRVETKKGKKIIMIETVLMYLFNRNSKCDGYYSVDIIHLHGKGALKLFLIQLLFCALTLTIVFHFYSQTLFSF